MFVKFKSMYYFVIDAEGLVIGKFSSLSEATEFIKYSK
jgi:hypothetical protein